MNLISSFNIILQSRFFRKLLVLSKIALVVFINVNYCSGQNLVPNPSFEIYDTCPSTLSAINLATSWSSFTQSPDYFNGCSPNINVPNNPLGYQPASEGQAYAGALMCGPIVALNAREFFGAQLIEPL